jgi:hypothetical protein
LALDLIKEYLVGIGFSIDQNSLSNAEESINNADKTIKNFNDNSNKGFSESTDSMKDLFSLVNLFTGNIGKLCPELQAPFGNLIKDITTVKKLYSDFNKGTEEKNSPKKASKDKSKSKEPKGDGGEGISIIPKNDESKSLVDNILDVKEASKGLANEGGGAIKTFVSGLGPEFAIAATAVVATIAVIGKLASSIMDLANQDIENEKLSRQLWTTKENAKEVDMGLKTLGVSMQDLWLSPTLLKQFNQLRQDSKELKLPKEYTENLKVVQGIGLEFKRLKQFGTLAFQWIGNYILKYAAGPLNDIKNSAKGFNDWLAKNIPGVAKVIGSTIGIIVRLLLELGEILGFLLSIQFKIANFISGLIPDSMKKILKIIAVIAALLMTGPVGIILLIIALIDDIVTFFEGGDSLTGKFFDSIKSGMDSIKDGWDYYWNKAKEAFEKIQKKAKQVWEDIKNFFPNLWNDAKGFASEVGTKVQKFAGNVNINSVPANYATPNISNSSSNTTSNSHNKVSNDNKFYIYGGNDSKATANAVGDRMSGIVTRNTQGVMP